YGPDGEGLGRPGIDPEVKATYRETLGKQHTAWHLEQAQEAARHGQRFAADWHLRRLVGREPARASFFGRRGAVYARLGQWDQAAADGAKTLELGDKRLKVERDYALLCLATANTDQYRRTCARLLERFGQTKDPAVANNVAWACVLAPNAVDDAKRPLQL